MLLKETIVPSTRLRASRDVPTMELLRVLGPQIGSLYQELSAVDPATLSKDMLSTLQWFERSFTVMAPDERIHRTGRIHEL